MLFHALADLAQLFAFRREKGSRHHGYSGAMSRRKRWRSTHGFKAEAVTNPGSFQVAQRTNPKQDGTHLSKEQHTDT